MPFTCSFHDVLCLQRPHPPTIGFNFNCHINKRETPKTCLANHKGSISHHITPLVINSLRGGDTHIQTSRTKAITRNQLHTGLWPAHAWFIILYIRILFLVSLLFVALINPYSFFKFLIFKYSSLFTFYSILKYIILMMVTSGSLNSHLQANRNNITGAYLIMFVYRHLLAIMLTWQSSYVIAIKLQTKNIYH